MTLSLRQYATHQGVTPKAVRKWIDRGMTGVARTGRVFEINKSKADAWVKAHASDTKQRRTANERRAMQGEGGSDNGATKHQKTLFEKAEAQAARERVRARMDELDLAEREGLLVKADDLRSALAEMRAAFTRQLRAASRRAAPAICERLGVSAARGPEVAEIIDAELVAACEEIERDPLERG